MLNWRLLPYPIALIVGLVAGTIADSPIVAALATLAAATIWAYADRRGTPPT